MTDNTDMKVEQAYAELIFKELSAGRATQALVSSCARLTELLRARVGPNDHPDKLVTIRRVRGEYEPCSQY